jgi:uncharacterized protein YxeA
MKKILGGCLIVLVIALIGFGVATFYAYRWARPMLDSTAGYLERAREMTRLGEEVTNQQPFTAPANGELSKEQVERFVAVQTRVHDELGNRWSEIEKKAQEINRKTAQDRSALTFSEFTAMFSELAGIYLDARRAQVRALNVQRFSDAEFSWVRLRVYQAAGMHAASSIDLSNIEKIARESAEKGNVSLPEVPKPDVPQANIELVKPHLAKLKQWLPMAVLGL